MNGDYNFDGIVIGAGHAGIEAGLALARTGKRTLVLSVSLDNIGWLACNPSIGGTAKGHLVREIDALGGEMGVAADKCLTSLRMLNASKGPAVQSLRAQIDKYKYHAYMKSVLENEKLVTLRQGEAKHLIVQDGKVTGVETVMGLTYYAPAVIVCSGVYLGSDIIVGDVVLPQGPAGFPRATYLTQSLLDLGIEIRRFKTGTPARVHKDSVDISKLAIQHGEEGLYSFSALSKGVKATKELCYLGYTNERTHDVIRNNLHLAPKYNGMIKGAGPRYCPSIEDKIVKFPDKTRHSFFLEPEGDGTKEMYVQGISTGLPASVQIEMYRTIEGFENVHIMRDAYAIEYDCINSLDLLPTLEYKGIKGLYFAGQVNGTSGYEEAGAQGLVAGLNASLALDGKPPLVLRRDNSYIGVMIDDLVTIGTDEPYRMMTSRAEYRLCLRQDNADIRLTEEGYKAGLVSKKRMNLLKKKKANLKKAESLLGVNAPRTALLGIFGELNAPLPLSGASLGALVKRPEITPALLSRHWDVLDFLSPFEQAEFFTDVRYSGYLDRQEKVRRESARVEDMPLDINTDYMQMHGLRIEAREKLNRIKPLTVGQASRIPGVTPADVNVLIIKSKK
ncbi:MAG: tRNA uridine-5-carboxymethylaminomethyl(34) synthesis enzyme MnmG [Clostridia bacterium]|nr:tRNA uridine-5-carboxymethylaminomethyl(34) synthesis enzyme MnmG [Clostridia bacterium]